jgi:hypothetical protein
MPPMKAGMIRMGSPDAARDRGQEPEDERTEIWGHPPGKRDS